MNIFFSKWEQVETFYYSLFLDRKLLSWNFNLLRIKKNRCSFFLDDIMYNLQLENCVN